MSQPEFQPEDPVLLAALEFVKRQARLTHPEGRFDSGGRWYPDREREKRECCQGIRSPSRRWPYSLLVHCRTAEHVARLYGVSKRDIMRAVPVVTALLGLALKTFKPAKGGRA